MSEVVKIDAPEPVQTVNLLSVIAKAASDPAVDIDKMERLIQMQERIQGKDAERAFAEAFAAMQPELPYITARNEIRHNNKLLSKYADWPSISRAILPILSAHGFGLNCTSDNSGDSVVVTAHLRHCDGHTQTNSVTLPSDKSGAKNNVQAIGSSITYGQRYSACPLVGVVIHGEDDDGGKADKPAPDIKDETRDLIMEMTSHKNAPKKLDDILKAYNVKSLKNLTEKEGLATIRALQKMETNNA